jgi:hypothetical protein
MGGSSPEGVLTILRDPQALRRPAEVRGDEGTAEEPPPAGRVMDARLRSKRCFGWRVFISASCSAGGGQDGWGR